MDVPKHILFSIRSIMNHSYEFASKEDGRSLRVRAHKVNKVPTSSLFRRNCTILQVLKAGTWSSLSTISAFYLQYVILRHMNTFSIDPVVVAQEIL